MPLDYDELDQQLRNASAEADAATCHGSLCGALCAPVAGEDGWQGDWLKLVFGDEAVMSSPAVQACTQSLLQLFVDTRKALLDDELGFQPLVPPDRQPLAVRASSLSGWCDGFVYGLGLATGGKDLNKLPGNTDEVVKDFLEISRAAAAHEDGDEEEGAYQELLEYVRVAAMLLFAERPQPMKGNKTIH